MTGLRELAQLFFPLRSIPPSEIANVWINPPILHSLSPERVELIATASAKPLLMSYSHYTHTHTQEAAAHRCTQSTREMPN